MSDTRKDILIKRASDAYEDAIRFYKSLPFANMMNPEWAEKIKGSAVNRKVSKIVVIGCGGTGSWLIPKLAKTINDANRKNLLAEDFELFLIDGDIVELKNIVRQNFVENDIGQNKAAVMANRYGPLIQSAGTTVYIDKYIGTVESIMGRDEEDRNKFVDICEIMAPSYPDESFSGSFPRNDIIVFNLVDNNKARIDVHATATRLSRRSRTYVIDVGNDMYNGQFEVSTYCGNYLASALSYDHYPYGGRRVDDDGVIMTYAVNKDNFFFKHPELLNATDDVSLHSCADADVDIDNQDQLLVANDFAATIGHNALVDILLEKLNSKHFIMQSSANFICGTTSSMNVLSEHMKQEFFVAFYVCEMMKTSSNFKHLKSLLDDYKELIAYLRTEFGYTGPEVLSLHDFLYETFPLRKQSLATFEEGTLQHFLFENYNDETISKIAQRLDRKKKYIVNSNDGSVFSETIERLLIPVDSCIRTRQFCDLCINILMNS
mgnify:CR=1 FL=1